MSNLQNQTARRLFSRPFSPFKTYILFLAATFALFFLARLLFLVYALGDLRAADNASASDIIHALYIGFRFDARLAAIITFPLGLLFTLPRGAILLGKCLRPIVFGYFLIFLLIIFAYVADFGHYLYLGLRINAFVFDLLRDFQVAVLMLWQSYPLLPIVFGILALTGLCTFFIFKLLSRCRPTNSNKKKAFLTWLAAFLIFAWAAYGQISSNLFPLRWSNAYFSTNPTINALALNPLQNLYDTWRSAAKTATLNLEAVREYYPLMVDFLGVDSPNIDKLTYLRHKNALPLSHEQQGQQQGQPQGQWAQQRQAEQQPQTRPNIVIIIMESLSFPKTSFAKGKADPTPHLRGLAEASLFFNNFYAPTRTTARAIFTTITGLPDINQDGNTSSRNPFLVDQRVIPNEFKGYSKYYLMGGSTSWANIRGVLANNITGLRILEESDWKAPNTDVWGISDLDLFKEANAFFNHSAEPFFAVIQTAGFHAPYTIPKTKGFIEENLNTEQLQNYGFVSEKEYNSLRLSDFALGEFMRLAKQSPYYQNTIFFIFGDHGLSDKSRNMPAAYLATGLNAYHVPLLIHAPGRVKPGLETMPSSQLDIMPTAASLAGIAYNNYTLGRDLFDKAYDNSRVAFVAGPGTTPIRLVQGEYCYYDNRAGSEVLYKLMSNSTADYSQKQPEIFKQMQELAKAIDTTTIYMLNNNSKSKKY